MPLSINALMRTRRHWSFDISTLHGKIDKFDRKKISFEVGRVLDLQSLFATKMASRLLKLSPNFRTLSQVHINSAISIIWIIFGVNFLWINSCLLHDEIRWKWRMPSTHCYIMTTECSHFVVFPKNRSVKSLKSNESISFVNSFQRDVKNRTFVWNLTIIREIKLGREPVVYQVSHVWQLHSIVTQFGRRCFA